jgi:hypothetical protein
MQQTTFVTMQQQAMFALNMGCYSTIFAGVCALI